MEWNAAGWGAGHDAVCTGEGEVGLGKEKGDPPSSKAQRKKIR